MASQVKSLRWAEPWGRVLETDPIPGPAVELHIWCKFWTSQYTLVVQWDHCVTINNSNLSNTDTFGKINRVLIREVSSFQGANNTYFYKVGTWSSVLIREASSFQGANNTYFYKVGTWSSVLIREVSLIHGCSLRGVSLYYGNISLVEFLRYVHSLGPLLDWSVYT